MNEETQTRHLQEQLNDTDSRHNDAVIISDLQWIREALKEMKESNTCDHKEMIAKQNITNGRVNVLEKEAAFSKGAIRILTLLSVPLILGAMTYIINFFLSRS